jgi:hypothetical protein
MKTKIWRDLARIGVITDRFGDDTTGRYSAKIRTILFGRTELKIKSRDLSVVRAESALRKAIRKQR